MEAWALLSDSCCSMIFSTTPPLLKERPALSTIYHVGRPVGPSNCGIGTFSAAELEKTTACRLRHQQPGGAGGWGVGWGWGVNRS